MQHKDTLAEFHKSCAETMRAVHANHMDDDEMSIDIKLETKKYDGNKGEKEDDGMLPDVSIKIPLRVPTKLLPLMCDVDQHQNHLKEGVRNLVVQVSSKPCFQSYPYLLVTPPICPV